MVLHAVKMTDLEAALASARTEASLILDQVNFVQRELQATTFVGEQAEALAGEMNGTMATFVAATYDNVDELLRVIVNNMNVVVTKLGGAPWPHQPVERGAATNAEALRISGNQDYEIDTDEMLGFATKVDEWFEAIVTSYHNVRGTIAEGTPGWQGPEKIVTVTAVTDAVETIVGAADGGSGVRGVGSSLSTWLRDQVAVMEGA
ncbi:MAG: hypothetical protein AAGA93_09235 [Actinomycetota bacterium]